MRTATELLAAGGRRLLAIRRGEHARYHHVRRTIKGLSRTLDELKAAQLPLLQQMIDRAYLHSPFYRKRFDACGFRPGDLRDFADMAHLPELTRTDLLNSADEMICDDVPPEQINTMTTAGTTGEPARFHRDLASQTYRRALETVIFRRCGWREGQWIGWMWGAPQDLIVVRGIKDRLTQHWGHRTYFVDEINITDEMYIRFAELTKKYRPTCLSAYPSLAYEMALRIEAGVVPPVRVPALSVTAEPLYEHQRRKLQEIVADRIYERYGAREWGLSAFECDSHCGWHIFTDSVYHEIVPRDGIQPPLGALLATDLVNRAMPLIRYQTGDVARIDETRCSCGLCLPRIREMQGREIDMVWRPDGSGIAGAMIVYVAGNTGIKTRVQIVQVSLQDIHLLYERNDQAGVKGLEHLTSELRAVMGDCFTYHLKPVAHIEVPVSGKYRYVRSNVERPKLEARG
jgi:phenylacetate-CoA ligase